MKSFVFLCLVALATAKYYNVQVQEKGVLFRETIQTKRKYQLVEVPAHNDRHHIVVLSNLELVSQIFSTCFPFACQTQRSGLIGDWETVVVDNKWAVVEQNLDRSVLTDARLRSFYPNLPLHRVQKLSEGAAILSGSTDAVAAAKRQLIGGTCSGNSDPQRMYAVSNPAGCEYLVFCGGQNDMYSECPRRHVTDTFFMVCLCCPEHTNREQCLFCQNLECSGYFDNTGVC
ncbi:Hypp6102 [Branchiostoma lanceolatum]|uniref:Hypp6102 protein n=1 Tax=Branchiostoma lanceolatum TaxID=7740 RepID=A0A8J9YSR3_BRALA|nr:Hypp6102 [Branchiostoma lanceolatum]